MSQIIVESLQKVAKGTAISFIGTIIGLGLSFATTVVVVRHVTQSEYGIYSLAITVVGIVVMLSLLGLEGGVARYIGYFKGKDDVKRISAVGYSSIKFALIAAIPLSLILFFTSDLIAANIFHGSGLSLPLKILAIGLPFSVLITVFTSIFRGLEKVEVGVYFVNFLMPSIFLVLVLAVTLWWGFGFMAIIYAYLASILFTFIAISIYTRKRLPFPLMGRDRGSPVGRELLLFSLPLLATGSLGVIMSYTDTLMLGNMMTSGDVGLYNTAVPLAYLLILPNSALLIIYTPVISGLYARNLMNEIKRNYVIVTKWISSLVLPLFLVLFLFPETVLDLIYSSNYIPASIALRILALGQIINVFLGPNGATLISLGKTRFYMWVSIVCAGVNVVLNILLIPLWGIAGAAVATSLSLVLMKIMRGIKLYSIAGTQPLSKNLLKPVLTSSGLIIIIYFIATNFIEVTFWMLPIIFILFYALYFLSMLITKSFDQEDIAMLLEIERRIGINASPIKRVVARFL
jgi:O-antigen/teichoic acid export membrane protein